jgi:hypothetical protein
MVPVEVYLRYSYEPDAEPSRASSSIPQLGFRAVGLYQEQTHFRHFCGNLLHDFLTPLGEDSGDSTNRGSIRIIASQQRALHRNGGDIPRGNGRISQICSNRDQGSLERGIPDCPPLCASAMRRPSKSTRLCTGEFFGIRS